MSDVRNVIIIGSGPAGWTAALYAARANLKPLLFSGDPENKFMPPGGQLMMTTDIENYPGFEHGIKGPELMGIMRRQSERFGAEVIDELVIAADLNQYPFKVTATEYPDGQRDYLAKSLIISTGARPRMLQVPGEEKWFGKTPGVSSCATCDGWYYRDKEIAVVGGGDSAMEEAMFLTHYATKVHVIHRRDQLRASKIMQDRAFNNPKIEFVWNTIVTHFNGSEKFAGAHLKNVKTGEEWDHPYDGVFYALGHIPNTDIFRGQLDLDEQGYLITDPRLRTKIPGVFAAGDCVDHVYRQAITAAGMGCMAAIEAERWLAEQ